VFAARGPAVVAYGLCALAVGTLAALLLRRSLPALAVAVTVMIVLNRYVERYREDFRPTAAPPRPSPPYRLKNAPEAHAPGSGAGRAVQGCGRPGAVLRYPERHVAVTIGSDGLATLTE